MEFSGTNLVENLDLFFKNENLDSGLLDEKTNKKYTLGDKINIEVKKADLVKKHLDFIII